MPERQQSRKHHSNPFTGLKGLRLLLNVSVVFVMFLLLDIADSIETAWQEAKQ